LTAATLRILGDRTATDLDLAGRVVWRWSRPGGVAATLRWLRILQRSAVVLVGRWQARARPGLPERGEHSASEQARNTPRLQPQTASDKVCHVLLAAAISRQPVGPFSFGLSVPVPRLLHLPGTETVNFRLQVFHPAL
jgi:hypothetical protein